MSEQKAYRPRMRLPRLETFMPQINILTLTLSSADKLARADVNGERHGNQHYHDEISETKMP